VRSECFGGARVQCDQTFRARSRPILAELAQKVHKSDGTLRHSFNFKRSKEQRISDSKIIWPKIKFFVALKKQPNRCQIA